jgi:hypothetical protein
VPQQIESSELTRRLAVEVGGTRLAMDRQWRGCGHGWPAAGSEHARAPLFPSPSKELVKHLLTTAIKQLLSTAIEDYKIRIFHQIPLKL